MSTAEPTRHARRKELFHEALERAPGAREAYLRQACGEDDDLRREVEEMLAVEEDAPQFLETTTPGEVLARSAVPAIPERLGPFRVRRLLGEGGMGAVYEAEQDRPRRLVALKVLHPGLGTPRMLRRFELEGEVLGRLQHPGIARIYEAGSTDTGRGVQPWFAMELVEGQPLNEYCTEQNLSLEERLELLASVADAVQHAHQRGVVHRDLKPANVLVDATGQVKVLDFGIARATEGESQGATLRTDPGMVVGTLQYMSPEQATADPDAIDVRTDVYSLGVMLYEIVAGRPPIDLSNLPIHEALRRVLEVEPEPLRRTGLRIPADVSVIAQTALAKDKDRRYASANGLAADLRRFLRREPIAAQPPTGVYLLRRFVARNKTLVGGAATTFVALALGLVLVVWQRNEAREALARAEGINSFLISDVLASPSPEKLGRDVRVVDVLGPALLSAQRTFAGRPRVAAEVLDAIGASYESLGLFAEAEPVTRRALELLGADGTDRLSLRARGNLVSVLTDLDRPSEAVPLAEEVVADSVHFLGAEDPDTLERRAQLAAARWAAGDHQRSVGELRVVAADRARVLGEEDTDTLSTQSLLAVNLAGTGEFGEAVDLLTTTLERQDRVLGTAHPGTLTSRTFLGWILTMGGEWQKAEALYNELLPTLEGVYGEDHPYTANARVKMAQCPINLGRPDEGEQMILRAIEDLESRVGGDHAWTLEASLALAAAYREMERYEDAVRMAEGVVAKRRISAPRTEDLAHALSTLGRSYQDGGDNRTAAKVYREAADVFRIAFDGPSDFLGQMLYNLGVVTRDMGNAEESIAPFEEALTIDISNWGADHRYVISGRYNLSRALLEAGRPGDAVTHMREALKSAGSQDIEREQVLSYSAVLGYALIGAEATEEGERILLEVVKGFEALELSDDESARRARQGLVKLYEKQGRVAEAALYRDKR